MTIILSLPACVFFLLGTVVPSNSQRWIPYANSLDEQSQSQLQENGASDQNPDIFEQSQSQSQNQLVAQIPPSGASLSEGQPPNNIIRLMDEGMLLQPQYRPIEIADQSQNLIQRQLQSQAQAQAQSQAQLQSQSQAQLQSQSQAQLQSQLQKIQSLLQSDLQSQSQLEAQLQSQLDELKQQSEFQLVPISQLRPRPSDQPIVILDSIPKPRPQLVLLPSQKGPVQQDPNLRYVIPSPPKRKRQISPDSVIPNVYILAPSQQIKSNSSISIDQILKLYQYKSDKERKIAELKRQIKKQETLNILKFVPSLMVTPATPILLPSQSQLASQQSWPFSQLQSQQNSQSSGSQSQLQSQSNAQSSGSQSQSQLQSDSQSQLQSQINPQSSESQSQSQSQKRGSQSQLQSQVNPQSSRSQSQLQSQIDSDSNASQSQLQSQLGSESTGSQSQLQSQLGSQLSGPQSQSQSQFNSQSSESQSQLQSQAKFRSLGSQSQSQSQRDSQFSGSQSQSQSQLNSQSLGSQSQSQSQRDSQFSGSQSQSQSQLNSQSLGSQSQSQLQIRPQLGTKALESQSPSELLLHIQGPSTYQDNLPEPNIQTKKNRINVVTHEYKVFKTPNYLTQEDILDNSKLTTVDLIEKYGYPSETNYVTSEDGYRLCLHRIPRPGAEPVLLVHGLMASSASWVELGPKDGLAYILYRKGYDVWMLNTRGNKYSRENLNRRLKPNKYWDFSFHEIGKFDVPAAIDHILSHTHKPKIQYIGHSQGSTVFFVMCSERPHYAQKVNLMQALSPTVYLQENRSPVLKFLGMFKGKYSMLLNLLGGYEISAKTKLIQQFRQHICSGSELGSSICAIFDFVLCGFDWKSFNTTLTPIVAAHASQGASAKQIYHYAQMQGDLNFQRFDHGAVLNRVRYESSEPPAYNLSQTTSKVVLHHGEGDWLGSTSDVIRLQERLPNLVESRKVNFEGFSHFDFTLSKDVRPLLYRHVLRHLSTSLSG